MRDGYSRLRIGFGVDTRAKRFFCDEKVVDHDKGFN